MKFFTLVILLLITFIPCAATSANDDGYYKVSAKSLNIRAQPNKYGTVLGSLEEGTVIQVSSIQNGWAKISYEGYSVYVSSKYLIPVTPPSKANVESKSSSSSSGKSWLAKKLPAINAPDIPKTTSLLWFYTALILAAMVACIELASDDGELYTSNSAVYAVNMLLFFALSVSELIYFSTYAGDNLWFCMPGTVGWIMTIVDFLIFGFLCVMQCKSFKSLLIACDWYGDRTHNVSVGILGWIAGLVVFFVFLFFWKEYIDWVVAGVLLTQVIQLCVYVYYNINDEGSWGNLALTILFYIIGSVATVVTLIHFLGLMIIVLIGLLVLAIFGHSSSGPARCSNCVTYDRGYCSYRRESVSSDDCCNKHISR